LRWVLSRKDIVLATELGRECDVPMPVASLAEQIVIEAMNRGDWGDRDRSITFRLLQEEAAGAKVRAAAVDPGKAATFVSTHPEGDG
jgi:hypothetical protein